MAWGLERTKRPACFLDVFTGEEVRTILLRLTGIKWLMYSLLYGAWV